MEASLLDRLAPLVIGLLVIVIMAVVLYKVDKAVENWQAPIFSQEDDRVD